MKVERSIQNIELDYSQLIYTISPDSMEIASQINSLKFDFDFDFDFVCKVIIHSVDNDATVHTKGLCYF